MGSPTVFAEPLDTFVAGLMDVGEHVLKHDFIVGAREVYEETREMADLYEMWCKNEGTMADEEQAWWDFWLYLGSKIRGWWD